MTHGYESDVLAQVFGRTLFSIVLSFQIKIFNEISPAMREIFNSRTKHVIK